jgi:cullin-associated NEDD8-dissociated protein 1
VQHFDLSFWAFEKLAHPLFGTMMLNFRPVDCYTKKPFDTFVPGFINETIYGDRVESGWSYNVYESDQNQFALPGAGVGGSNATCLAPRAKGGVTFTARNGSASGYQPFTKANTLTISIRNNGTAGNTGVPQNLKLTLQNTEQELYCGGNVILGQTVQPSSTKGDYSVFSIPMGQFGCNNPSLAQVDALGIQNTGDQSEAFCMDDIALVGGTTGSTATAGRKLK